MTSTDLRELIGRLSAGTEMPRRVVVDSEGTAVDPWRAASEFSIRATLCFIRNDGWTLAAPVPLAGVAYAMWRESWVALVQLPDYGLAPPSHN